MSSTEPESSIDRDHLKWIRELAGQKRFGDRDRYGTANLIDSAALERARCARTTGEGLSLSRPLAAGTSRRGDDRPTFRLDVFHTDRGVGVSTDHLELDCHSISNTHVDALNHLAVDGTWYGGWAVGEPDAPSIVDISEKGLVTRGVHLDIAALRGTPWVSEDAPVTGADLERALAEACTQLEPGDAIIVDMGRDRFESAGNLIDTVVRRPGIGVDGARWIADHSVSVLCWDFLDAAHPDEPYAPVHLLNWAIGLWLVDNCDFRRLRAVRKKGPAECTLVIAPLPIRGGTGCNVNPIVLL
jgi:kynurenine formamidase